MPTDTFTHEPTHFEVQLEVDAESGVASVELDVALSDFEGREETPDEACAALTAGTEVTHEVVREYGPAAGTPLVRFTGPRRQLETVLERYAKDCTAG